MEPSSEEDRVEFPFLDRQQPKAVFGIPGVAAKADPHPTHKRSFMESLTHEYHLILDEPKRLPFFFHPIVSRDRVVPYSEDKHFFTPHFFLTDEQKVPRRFYLNLQIENLAFGAVGGLLVGLGTQRYFLEQSRFKEQVLKNTEGMIGRGLVRIVSGAVTTTTIVKRAVLGAVLYDCLKRNSEKIRDKDDDWYNAAFAGAICGGVFGIRGGLQSGAIGAIGFSTIATFHHVFSGFNSVT